MTNILGSILKKHIFLTFIILVGMSLTACTNDKPDQTDHGIGRGELQVHLQWQTKGAPLAPKVGSSGKDVCDDFLITWIRVRVKDSSGRMVAESPLLPCADHRARMDAIPARSGYTVEVEGFIDNQVIWSGERTNVNVISGKSTEPVMVTMTYIGKKSSPPLAEIDPINTAVDVPTDRTVKIKFKKPMVASSLTSDTIRVLLNGQPVPGTLTYNSKTLEAVFKPDEPLAVFTTYTVIVTTAVMDLSGQTLAEELNTQFTTTQVWYVDATAAKSGTGKSWDKAFNTIGQAVTAAGDSHQIWVRHGTYHPTDQIMIDKPIVLLGGFKGTETQHHQRDWKAWETLVDGKSQKRCFFISDNATINGFSIANCSPPTDDAHGYGGAIYIEGSSPMIIHCLFEGNFSTGSRTSSGGAIYNNFGNPIIKNSNFINNSAYGGWMSFGGAIYNNQGGPIISDCIFKMNNVWNTLNFSGNIQLNLVYGGAIYNDEAKSSTAITDCLFDSNTASAYLYGGGGAISNDLGEISISGCHFSNNSAKGNSASIGRGAFGGAVNNYRTDAIIQNCTFFKNQTISIELPKSEIGQNYGGAIANINSTVSIAHCTFSTNEAVLPLSTDKEYARGGAVANLGSEIEIINSILWGNQAGDYKEIFDDKTANTTVSYSNINQNINDSQNIIYEVPRFATDLHLAADSPCRGKADNRAAPETDIDGESRPTETPADIGADQFIDSDDDHMPDWWETLHQVDNSDNDDDGDRLSNLDEYRIGTDPHNAQYDVDAVDSGTVRDDGRHLASDSSTTVGKHANDDTYRSYFVFNLSNNAKPVKNAAIRLEVAAYDSEDPVKKIEIWNVSATSVTLSSDTSGQAGIDIYNDMGSGILYGQFEVTASDVDGALVIPLNRSALAAVNVSISDKKEFIIGLSMTGHVRGTLAFSTADESRIHQLVLSEE